MYKGQGLWLSIITILMLTTVGIAQDEDRNPDKKQLDSDQSARADQDRTVTSVRQTIPLLQQASKSVNERYNLDEMTINGLRQSINELVETLLEQPEAIRTLATAARRHRDRGAVARHLAAWLDQQLSLTVDQREKIGQRLIVNADKGGLVDAGDILWGRLRPEAIIRRRFKHPPDDVLSQTQLVIWKQLVVSPKFNIRGQIPEHAKAVVAQIKADIMEDLKAGNIAAHKAVELRLEFRDGDIVEVMEIELWDEDKDDNSESQEEMRRIAEAKLAAHTEQLGPLEESASQRLTLATKGVVEEYLDAQGEDSEVRYEEAEKEVRKAVAVGELTNQEAAQKLEELKRRLHAEERATDSYTDITYHPLYQQTIKDVLSEEGFAQYRARQAERQRFRQQALREVLVASMDAELFLSDEQRKHFEMAAEELFALSAPDEVLAPVYIAYQLCQRTDYELLSPWQREEFERIHRELERKVKFSEKR